MTTFTCVSCGAQFEVPASTLSKYPGWTPRYCLLHKKASTPRPTIDRYPEENLTLATVLAKYSGGPLTGVFTDGSAVPNPGPGGWGVVWVKNGEIVDQRYGESAATTNNRMELTALIEAHRMLPVDAELTIYTDSQLCVNTVNKWAPGWERRGWKKKGGEIRNLELVQELVTLSRSRPKSEIAWIAAHSGNRWNEYADSLATAWRRETL